MTTKQVDIKTSSFRIVHETPGHVTYGIWINGGKAGDLTVRQNERVAFTHMLTRAGFQLKDL